MVSDTFSPLITAMGLDSPGGPFNQDPQTDQKLGDYRLYTKMKVRFCCSNNKVGRVSFPSKDKDGGLEFELPTNIIIPRIGPKIRIKGTINLSKPVVIPLTDGDAMVEWKGWGRPNKLAEPGMQWVQPRTSVNIWHKTRIILSCKKGSGTYTIKSFKGSNYPSRRLWVDGVRKRNVPKGSLSSLWDPLPTDPTFVNE